MVILMEVTEIVVMGETNHEGEQDAVAKPRPAL